MALQLDIEAVAEARLQPGEAGAGEVVGAGGEGSVERAGGAAGQRDQAVEVVERVVAHMRFVAVGRVEPDAADEPHQGQIAALVAGDQHQRRAGEARRARTGRGVAEIDRELRADQRLHAGLFRLLGKLQRAEQVVGVGERDGRRLVRLGALDEGLDGNRALAQRIGAVDVGVDEADGFQNRGIHGRR